MEEKITKATIYVERLIGSGNIKEIMNDAANFFADSEEEYLAIWNALVGN